MWKIWTETENQQLHDLVQISGLSAGAIAKKLDKTRSAVIGRCFRLKLSLPNSGTKNYYVNVNLLKEKKKKAEPKLRLKPEYAELPKEPVAPSEPLNLSLLELQICNCRFILENNKYCGLPIIKGSSWCGFHHPVCINSKTSSRTLQF
jgi:hypothetical protein